MAVHQEDQSKHQTIYMMSRSIFSAGALVKVRPKTKKGKRDSEGGLAFVTSFDKARRTVDVEYTTTGLLSQEVEEDRLEPSSLALTARRRSPDEMTKPLLLSIAHHKMSKVAKMPNPIMLVAKKSVQLKGTAAKM